MENREIISNEYIDGKRVSVVKITYAKSNDVRELGNLQHQLANILQQLESASGDVQTAYLKNEVTKIEERIHIQKSFVDGYPIEEVKEEER